MSLRIFEVLNDFSPMLTGTIPIEVDLPSSDLDIICEFQDSSRFEFRIAENYDSQMGFELHRTQKQGLNTIIARFQHHSFDIEIFGQPLKVTKQMAYRHMIREHEVLQSKDESFRLEVIDLKKQGFSTEAAFAKLLGIEGDPYEGLLDY